MSKTVDQIRRENGVKWDELTPQFSYKFKRNWLYRIAKDVIHLHRWNWLVEIALCEATNRVQTIQTDIEDFVPTTQRRKAEKP